MFLFLGGFPNAPRTRFLRDFTSVSRGSTRGGLDPGIAFPRRNAVTRMDRFNKPENR